VAAVVDIMEVSVVLGMGLRYNQADHMLEQVEELHQLVTLVSMLVETAHKTLVEVAVALLSKLQMIVVVLVVPVLS
jgi:hypothetical protein